MKVTPPHLQPILSRVKRYVEKLPEGATLTQISNKVSEYHKLNRKDRAHLIEIIRDSGQLVVLNTGKATIIHHPKYGYKPQSEPPEIPAPMPAVYMGGEMSTMNKVTPEELRRQAEEMIRAAAAIEETTINRAEIKKQLDPVKLEVMQSYGMASRKFDEFIDAMSELGNAVQKLNQLSL